MPSLGENRPLWGFVAALCALAAVNAGAAPLIVSAHRTPAPGASVTVFDAERIARLGKPRVLELLRLAVGADTVRTGGIAGQSSVFLRGTNSNHVLVLLDGVPLNDPVTGIADLADLSTDGIERVEILRGPQGGVYGSEALGGVIRIFSYRGRPPGLRGHVEAGSYDSLRGGLEFAGGGGQGDCLLRLQRHVGEGPSHAAGASERDGFQHSALTAHCTLLREGGGSLQASARYADTESDLDDYLLSVVDDPDYRHRKFRWLLRLDAGWAPTGKRWRQHLSLDYARQRNRFYNGPLAADSLLDDTTRVSLGARTRLGWRHEWRLPRRRQFHLGLQTERERVRSELRRSLRRHSVWAQYRFPLRDLRLSADLRGERHGRYGSRGDWRGNAEWPLAATGIRLHGGVGTGYRAPTLSDLYHPSFGNPQLRPERSRGWEWGLEWQHGGWRLRATRFEQRLANLIEYDFAAAALVNAGRAYAGGHEWQLQLELTPRLRLDGGYTRTDAYNRDSRQPLLRRPRHKAHGTLQWAVKEGGHVALTARYVGRRLDVGNVALGGYAVLDLAAGWRLAPGLELLLRVDNLLNRNYREVDGYGVPERGLYLGLRRQ